MRLSLLTFNTLGTPLFAPDITKRYRKLAKLLDASNTTFVCLQEVTTYYHLFLLKKHLKQYPYVAYQKFLYGPKGGLVIFSKLPLEKVSYREFRSLGQLTNISFYTRLLRNGLLMCRVKDLNLTLLTTHLMCDFVFDWAPDNKLYPQVEQQILDVIAQTNEFEKTKQSFIACGDFNINKNSRLYKLLLTKTKLTDSFANKNHATYSSHRVPYHFSVDKEVQIDHIFYHSNKPKLTVVNRALLFKDKEKFANNTLGFLSDHIGLTITFDVV